jgi:hypothetical protein
MYKKGEEICKFWASKNLAYNNPSKSDENSDDNSRYESDDESITSQISNAYPLQQQLTKDRYRFDQTMYDCLGHATIIKVYSHQLKSDFLVKTAGKNPAPNLFSVSANQIADNTANYAQIVYSTLAGDSYDYIFYPPFSPEWCFAFEGKLVNKGATRLFNLKLDEELLMRLQHRPKQGLFARLYSFNSLNSDHIGEETIYRNLVKMTAMCWTRSTYLDANLIQLLWQHWRNSPQNVSIIDLIPNNIPKRWKNIPMISNNVIRACPFC